MSICGLFFESLHDSLITISTFVDFLMPKLVRSQLHLLCVHQTAC